MSPQPQPQPQSQLRQRLRGLAATTLLLLLVVGFPIALIAVGVAPWEADLSRLGILLTSPDDGTLALAAVAVVGWIAWAVMAVSVVVATIAALRGLPAATIPGFALPQRAAGQLVTVAALLFVAAPTIPAAFPAPPAHAAAAPARPAPVPSAPVLPSARFEAVAGPVPGPVMAVRAGTQTSHKHEQATRSYTVKRGDSLWRIAERLLGNGARYTEIVDLNRAVLNGRPDFIMPGTVLKVPDEATDPQNQGMGGEYVVKPGDTLSAIAEAELGNPTLYPELFAASRHTVQPDGAKLTDPRLIRPGWKITIPGSGKHTTAAPKPPVQVAPPVTFEAPDPPAPTAASPVEPPPTATAEPGPAISGPIAEDPDATVPAWLLPGLTGAGALLAGLVLLAMRAHRNTQLRYRRPGQSLVAPPAALRAVEKTAFVSGAPLTATIEQLDRALRHLAATCDDEARAMPTLATVTLAGGTATLHLAEDADLPGPWAGAGREWSTRLGPALPDRDVIAPYPLLVTLGQDESGGLHLVNLEHLRVVSLTGDPTNATCLARHIAAELALNPWSVLVDVDLIGCGAELACLDSLRLRHHTDGEQVVASITRSLTSARDAGWGDPDPYRVVLSTGDGTGDLVEVLSSAGSRLGAALICVGAPVPGSSAIEVDRAGRLRAPVPGLDLVAAGLTSDEAAACAAIVEVTRDSEPSPIPVFEPVADGWRALTDQAGALRRELTDVRQEGPAGDQSLLSGSTEEYVEVAATTAEDVQVLAPVVPGQVRRTVEEADPALEEDVASWFDAESKRPRLMLLGPVNARAFGALAPAITKRKPYFVEMLAFLALHPEGVTGGAVADAFSVAGSRARTDLGILRGWLGQNPRTAREYLPRATKSPAFEQTGVRTYQVQDVLVDVDLFRRLRARGQARGALGIEDLERAMRLVEGVPFSHLRDKGWSWLLDTERLHETIGCAIVDTAHILVMDALGKGDLTAAREAAQTACKAAPHDDICRLDLVKVAAAEGHEETAEQMLTADVFNRTDDYLPPIDLPERTGEVVDKQGWGSSRRPRNP